MKYRPVIALFFFGLPLASQTYRVAPQDVPVVTQDSIVVYFRVLGENGHPFAGLRKEDVALTDDGRSVPGFTFHFGEHGASASTYIVLALDASGSMRGDGKLQWEKSSAISMIEAMGPGDYCALLSFSTRVQLLSGFTNDKAVLTEKVSSIMPRGNTALFDALNLAVGQLRSQPEQTNKLILLISDGVNEGGLLLSLAELSPRLESVKGLSVHTFDIRTKQRGTNDLRRIAMLGNGSYTYDGSPERVSTALRGFLSDYRKTYAVSYPAPRGDRGRHRILASMRLGSITQQVEFLYTVRAPFVSEALPDEAGKPFYEQYLLYLREVGAGLSVIIVLAIAIVLMRRRAKKRLHRMSMVARPSDDEKTTLLDRSALKGGAALGYLVLKRPDHRDQLIEIKTPEVLVGRSAQCAVRIDDTGISRVHAKIRLDPEGFYIFDLGSTNGTIVNGGKIQEKLLKDGDEILLGSNSLVFRATAPAGG